MMRTVKDALARRATGLVAALPGLLVAVIVVGLFLKSRAILGVAPLSKLLFSPAWHPVKGEFGLLPFIAGTVWVTVTAMVLAVPVSILAAVYLSEYAPRGVREAAKPVVDLLAGLPSVVYGVWGVLLVVPFVSGVLAPLAGVYSSGYSILAGGIVLAVMSFPTIIHVTLEVFTAVPRSLRDASLSLGATKWETTRRVVLRKEQADHEADDFAGREVFSGLFIVFFVEFPDQLFKDIAHAEIGKGRHFAAIGINHFMWRKVNIGGGEFFQNIKQHVFFSHVADLSAQLEFFDNLLHIIAATCKNQHCKSKPDYIFHIHLQDLNEFQNNLPID